MRKRSFTMNMAGVAVLILVLSGCSGHSESQINSSRTIQGVAASGAPLSGVVTLKDAAVPSRVITTSSAANGSFSFHTSGLTQPFMLSVSWTDSSGTNQLYSFANGSGTANINPFSNAVFAASSGVFDLAALFNNPDPNIFDQIASKQATISDSLRSELAPLLERYGTAANPVTDVYNADHTGLDAMFDDVQITASNGSVVVTNRQTGAVIFTSPMSDIASGTFNADNMPGGTGAVDGTALYTSNCSLCHGPLDASTVGGATAAAIQAAIRSVGTMTSLSNLFALQIQAIATVLTSAPTPSSPPPSPTTCSYTYDEWGACQSNNTQTRDVLTTAPSGCIGTPVVSQACTYTPPQACIYTYSDWGACWLYMQTRTVLTTAPSGCIGTPVLLQSCSDYTPPPSTLTLAQVTKTCTACHNLIVNSTVLLDDHIRSTYNIQGRSAFDWYSTVYGMTGQGAVLAQGTTVENYANFLATLP